MVVQHLDYVQRTWLDSTVWPPSAWSAFKQPARTNNDVEGWQFGTRVSTAEPTMVG